MGGDCAPKTATLFSLASPKLVCNFPLVAPKMCLAKIWDAGGRGGTPSRGTSGVLKTWIHAEGVIRGGGQNEIWKFLPCWENEGCVKQFKKGDVMLQVSKVFVFKIFVKNFFLMFEFRLLWNPKNKKNRGVKNCCKDPAHPSHLVPSPASKMQSAVLICTALLLAQGTD